MHEYLLDLLQCPACQGVLEWEVSAWDGDRIETAQAHCAGCHTVYTVRDGIGIFLTPDLPRNDLWEQLDSQLANYLTQYPDIEKRLMQSPASELSPADCFFKAVVLEERGNYVQAKNLFDEANAQVYTPEYLICQESQVHYVLDQLAQTFGLVVDLASGRAGLVQEIVRHYDRPVVATDFSLRVLRRDRRWLEAFGLYRQVSLLAFDARRTPFKDGAVPTLTTNLGLANIQHPGNLPKELRRIVAGELLAVVAFYAQEDEVNAQAIHDLGLPEMLFRPHLLKSFTAHGWKLRLENVCRGRALPTPKGKILQGVGIDTLPVSETELEWTTLVAS